MENDKTGEPDFSNLPEAVIKEVKTPISIVWIVPLVALLIGGWLVYKALSEKGPTITISFKTAEGLEAGKTKIKYKDVDLGQVDKIELSSDVSRVVVQAQLVKSAESLLTENTRFWVVRARLSAGEVSGLGTLFSGAYIGMDPGNPGETARNFIGLEIPPIVTANLPGAHFALRAVSLGSLDIGSPVYYRQIKVGQVVVYHLEEDGKAVIIEIFVGAPHHQSVNKNTRFWNASGLDVTLDVNGIRVSTESLVTLILGGIAFDTPTNLEPGGPAETGDVFLLYDSREKISEKTYANKFNWLLYFDGSVRGLSAGAPVEFKGIQVGKVLDVSLELSPDRRTCRIPVLIETEPERFWPAHTPFEEAKQKTFMINLVKKGLRAKLKTGNLLTGQLLVDLDLYPNADKEQIDFSGKYPKLPTLPGPTEEIMASLTRLLTKLDAFPIEAIGQDLRDTARGINRLVNASELREAVITLNETLSQAQELMTRINTGTVPEFNAGVEQFNAAFSRLNTLVQKLNDEVTPTISATLQQAQGTLSDIDSFVHTDASLFQGLKRALSEIEGAARAIRVTADYISRHPDALIYGKGTEK